MRVQELFLSGDKRGAAAAIPTKMVEEIAIIGPLAKIKDDLQRWTDTVATSLLIGGPPQFLELVAKVLL